jgi:two-component system sensor histidine kinase VicK
MEVMEDIRLLHPNSRIKLKCGPDVSLCADRDKIFQVLHNLLGNAIKYSGTQKEVIIRLGKRGGYFLFSVKDFGIGIAADDQLKVFERFFRVNREQVPAINGYGLGLYLCRQIIWTHKGEIWLKSRGGQGSCFYFTLPLAITPGMI